jgi:hypothetical protein
LPGLRQHSSPVPGDAAPSYTQMQTMAGAVAAVPSPSAGSAA